MLGCNVMQLLFAPRPRVPQLVHLYLQTLVDKLNQQTFQVCQILICLQTGNDIENGLLSRAEMLCLNRHNDNF